MKTVLVLVAALSLMACSKDGGGSKSDAKRNLADHQIIQKTKLMDSQKEEIHTIMSKVAKAPDMYLILAAPDNSEEGKENKEKEIRKLTPEAKINYDRILADCEISTPARSATGSDDVGGKSIMDYLGTADGAHCPVTASRKERIEISTLEDNLKELQQEYQKTNNPEIFKKYRSKKLFNSDVVTANKITDPKMQAEVGYKSESSTQSTTGSATSTSTTEGSQSSSTTKGRLQLVTIDDQQMTADVLIEEERSGGQSESYSEISIQYPSSDVVVQVFRDKQGEKWIYLNGESITEAQLKTLFGDKFGMGLTGS